MSRGALISLCLLLGACSVLVDPGEDTPRCELRDGQADPCGGGLECRAGLCLVPRQCEVDGQGACPGTEICQDGRCVAPEKCAPSPEVCGDGIDNDCDGEIDEEEDPEKGDICGDQIDNNCDGQIDEGHDADGDGNLWCGDITQTGGGLMADCNERDPEVYFGAPERCDGADNDCNGLIDDPKDGESLCPAGQQCLGRCVEPSCAVPGSITCVGEQICNIVTGACVDPAPCQDTGCGSDEVCDSLTGKCAPLRANGESCSAHADCRSGSCVAGAALGLRGDGYVCAQTCCHDGECASDEACFDSSKGARSCLPRELVLRSAAQPAPCSSDRQCRGGEVCGLVRGVSWSAPELVDRSNATLSACRVRGSGEANPGANANYNPDKCTSQAAIEIRPLILFFLPTFLCTATCATTADCAVVAQAASAQTRTYCSFEQLGGSTVPMCVVASNDLEIGSGDLGATCQSGADCRDGACVGASSGEGFCAPTCCNDSQCGKLGGRPTFCRPVAFGSHYETRCVP